MPVGTPPISSAPPVLPWYAVRVRSNFERVAAQALAARDFELFLPTYRARRRWSDRIKELEAPLFPGYVFCRFDLGQRLPVLTCPGVVGVVEFGSAPAPIPDSEIAAVRTILEARLQAQPWPFLSVGQRVRIHRGPLAGVEGVIEQFKAGYRLVVTVELLQRSVAADIEGDWVEPARSTSPQPAASF